MNFDKPILDELLAMRAKGIDINARLDALTSPGPPQIVLNDDQQKAFKAIRKWLASSEPYFALKGYAGTGKSLLMSYVSKLDYNFYFSAPTNKAAKVLQD